MLRLLVVLGWVCKTLCGFPSIGTVRFGAAQLLGVNFTTFTGGNKPTITPGGNLRFSANSPVASGIIWNQHGHQGDVVIDLNVAAVLRHPNAKVPGYEAIPAVLLASTAYNMSSDSGPRLVHNLKLHATINATWAATQVFNNNSQTPSTSHLVEKNGAMSSNVLLRLILCGDLVWGSIYIDEVEGWWGAIDAINGGPQWSPTPATTSSSPLSPTPSPPLSPSLSPSLSSAQTYSPAIFIDPDYAAQYQIDISWLDVWSDSDRDGLSDCDENDLGTSATKNDTDGDGVNDWNDLRPLDPVVGELSFDLFCNKSVGDFISAKITATKEQTQEIDLIFLNNTQNTAIVPQCLNLPRLPVCSNCVVVVGEERTLSVQADGMFVDMQPLPALSRRGYSISGSTWDGVLSDVVGVVFNASIAGEQRVDLRHHIASVRPSVAMSAFTVISVSDPALFSATMVGTHVLVITTPSGVACGSANVTLGVSTTNQQQQQQKPFSVNLLVTKRGALGPNLFENPNFDNVSKVVGDVPGWKVNLWNGDFKFSQPEVVVSLLCCLLV